MDYKSIYKMFLSVVNKSRIGTVTPIEFVEVFNLAQEEVVTNKMSAMGMNKKIIDDLMPLFRTLRNINGVKNDNDYSSLAFTLTVPTNMRRVVRITASFISGINAKISLLKNNEESEMFQSVYSRPTARQSYYKMDMVSGTPIIVVFSPKSISSLRVTIEYYVNPTRITESLSVSTTESIWNIEMITEIVNVAARMYLEKVADQRVQTYNSELKNKSQNQ